MLPGYRAVADDRGDYSLAPAGMPGSCRRRGWPPDADRSPVRRRRASIAARAHRGRPSRSVDCLQVAPWWCGLRCLRPGSGLNGAGYAVRRRQAAAAGSSLSRGSRRGAGFWGETWRRGNRYHPRHRRDPSRAGDLHDRNSPVDRSFPPRGWQKWRARRSDFQCARSTRCPGGVRDRGGLLAGGTAQERSSKGCLHERSRDEIHGRRIRRTCTLSAQDHDYEGSEGE